MLQIPKLKKLSFLVYGLGISGRSVISFLKKNNHKNFKVWDDNNNNIYENFRPKNLNQALKEVDYIILAPGVSLLKHKNLKNFKKKIITDIDLFYLSKNKQKSIVVTGTNGKSTTCKLLAHLLKKNKFKFCDLYFLNIFLFLSSQTSKLLILFFLKNFTTEHPDKPKP